MVLDNKSSYQELVDQNSIMYQLHGDINPINTTTSDVIGSSHAKLSYNIMTGWLTKMIIEDKYTNGTVYGNLEIVVTSNGLSGFELTLL